MPNLGLGLFIGDPDADAAVGPPIDGELKTENGFFLNTENGDFISFEG